MPYQWNPDRVRWYLAASAYTGFHDELAGALRPYLRAGDTLCDLGCGPGLLSLALAPHLRGVTAVDIDPDVLGELRQRAAQQSLGNITVVHGSAQALSGVFDALLLCFFGAGGDEVLTYLPLCTRTALHVADWDSAGGLYPRTRRHSHKATAADVQEAFEKAGVPYRLIHQALEFGQPLRNRDDGLAFLRDLAPEAPDAERVRFLDGYARETGREDYPLYLPNHKELGLFVVDATAWHVRGLQ